MRASSLHADEQQSDRMNSGGDGEIGADANCYVASRDYAVSNIVDSAHHTDSDVVTADNFATQK